MEPQATESDSTVMPLELDSKKKDVEKGFEYEGLKSDSNEKGLKAAPTGRQIHGLSWALVVGSILTSTFLFGLDNTIVADVQPAIVGKFNSISRLPWLSIAFMIGAASTTLFWSVILVLLDKT